MRLLSLLPIILLASCSSHSKDRSEPPTDTRAEEAETKDAVKPSEGEVKPSEDKQPEAGIPATFIALPAEGLVGIWKSTQCTFTTLDGGSWAITFLSFAKGHLYVQQLLYPTAACDFYRSRMEYASTYTFDGPTQKLQIAYTSCTFQRLNSDQKLDCSKELGNDQSFTVQATSLAEMTMNNLQFKKISD